MLMARKRPYNYSGNARPNNNRKYKTNTRNNGIRKNNYNNKDKKTDLEKTLSIKIDDERLNDVDTLDTSFLEGRMDKKTKNKKKYKEKLLRNKPDNRKIIKHLKVLKNVFFGLAFICIFVLIVLVLLNHPFEKTKKVKDKSTDDTTVIKNDKVIDDNYLFVGDFYTDKFNFDDLDYHYVKIADKDLTTEKLLNDLDKKVYDFNPSHVFINVGMNDLDGDKSNDEIIDNLENIIKGIKDNRPYAKVFIESLYPINKDVDDYDDKIIDKDIDNKRIKELNSKIKELCKKEKIEYLDLYSVLESDDKLNSDYTENGIYLNDKGYDTILEKINKILG